MSEKSIVRARIDYHIRPDLILIYRKPDATSLPQRTRLLSQVPVENIRAPFCYAYTKLSLTKRGAQPHAEKHEQNRDSARPLATQR
jgi:hypothetical protein